MIVTEPHAASLSASRLCLDLTQARGLGTLAAEGDLSVRALQGRENIWLQLALRGNDVALLRVGPHAGEIANVQLWPGSDGSASCEFSCPAGAVRAKVTLFADATVRCVTSLLPGSDVQITGIPRDLYLPDSHAGRIHTTQRGFRSGIVFASTEEPAPLSILYFQNFSSLSEYFNATKRTPADSVGGTWPELGYAAPGGEDAILPHAREITLSDAFVTLMPEAPAGEGALAELYVDAVARIYLHLDRPAVRYHDWATRAEQALRDLSLSPRCIYVRQGRRFLMPYAGDASKPPESMVQFTVAVNADEYDVWRAAKSTLAARLRATAPAFFDEDLGSIVRWLPGETFADGQSEDNMNHDAMDSWYLHHALFNTFRLAQSGDSAAKELFRKSLPYVVRVAQRFDYRWPIFFHLRTLDVIRAEAKPGAGGENDVAGLYALVMIHAYEIFGDELYLREAQSAASRLHGLGFRLAYQLNTTGFAAEAALRLWIITHDRSYLELSTICIANLIDNLWLWQCDYEHARHYPTFFGLFPLRDAPYLAPYEELEAQAKFNEYLRLGGDDVRPSLRLLLAEFQKYALDRAWYYYPDALPLDAVADKPRNGQIERTLAVPLEDLHDGREQSGSVGQEIYGAGLPFVMTARHYMRLDGTGMLAFCDYPMYDFTATPDGGTWHAGGDERGSCTLRVMPATSDAAACRVQAWIGAGSVEVPVSGALSAEGHALFGLRGGQTVRIACSPPLGGDDELVIGAFAARGSR